MSLYRVNSRLKRDNLLFVLIVLVMIVIIVRAFYVQVIQADFLQSEGDKRQVRMVEIPAPRGEVFDRNGSVLALSTQMASVWIDPKVLAPYLEIEQQLQEGNKAILKGRSPAEIARLKRHFANYQQLMSLLGLSMTRVAGNVFENPNRRFFYLRRSVVPELAEQISKLNLPGVHIDDEYKRYYPAGKTTAHLVGFTDIDDNGLSGIELIYDDWLSGEPGKKRVIKDRRGNVIDFVKYTKEVNPGKSLHLSIDKNIQFFLERALKRVMIEQEPESVSSVILDAQTGEVLGLVNLPAFNPNDRTQLKGKGMRNRIVTDILEPGSTIKPLVVAKALEIGVLGEFEEIDTSPGAVTIQGHRISDVSNKGVMTAESIIRRSSNVAMTNIALRMSAKELWQFYNDLGFGHSSGVHLPGESVGFIRRHERWQEVEQASASFGYGFSVNLLQLARSYSIFTNNGRLLLISILKKVPDSNAVIKPQKQVISPEIAQKVLKMMETVVSPTGTGSRAQIAGYRVAGKTGTTHKTKAGGYKLTKYNAMFAGIVPVSNPRFIMVVLVNEPSRGVYFGGQVAAPVFREVMQEVLRLYNVPKDARGISSDDNEHAA